jgi:hypothetical protein
MAEGAALLHGDATAERLQVGRIGSEGSDVIPAASPASSPASSMARVRRLCSAGAGRSPMRSRSRRAAVATARRDAVTVPKPRGTSRGWDRSVSVTSCAWSDPLDLAGGDELIDGFANGRWTAAARRGDIRECEVVGHAASCGLDSHRADLATTGRKPTAAPA